MRTLIVLALILAPLAHACRASAQETVCTIRPLSQGSGVVRICEVKR